jgi:hypothetical protein
MSPKRSKAVPFAAETCRPCYLLLESEMVPVVHAFECPCEAVRTKLSPPGENKSVPGGTRNRFIPHINRSMLMGI